MKGATNSLIRFSQNMEAAGSEDTKVSVRGSGAQEDNIIGLGILLDGMPLNQGDGEAFLQDLDLRSVKYAEVYRGADALRYGSITLGGAINLITMTGRDAPRLETWLTGGSSGLLETGILSGSSKGPFDAFLTASSHFLDGFRDHSQEDSQKVFFSLGCRVSQWAENRLYPFCCCPDFSDTNFGLISLLMLTCLVSCQNAPLRSRANPA